jgi:hypothetical protein
MMHYKTEMRIYRFKCWLWKVIEGAAAFIDRYNEWEYGDCDLEDFKKE